MSNHITRFMIDSLKPFKGWVVGLLLVTIIWAADLSLSPYLLKVIIDKIPDLTSDNVAQQLIGPISLYLSLSLLTMSVARIDDFIWLKLNSPLKRYIGHILMQRMMSHSLAVFQNHFAGNLANKINDVMSGIPSLLRVSIFLFSSRFIALIIAIFTVWNINYKFAILLFIWVVIFIIGAALFTKRAKQLCDQSAEAKSSIVGQIVDTLSNMPSVHLFVGSKTESHALKLHLDKSVVASQKRDWWFLAIFTFQGLSFIIYQALGFVFLVADFKIGHVTAGDFALLVSINIGLVSLLWSLSSDIITFSEIVGNITQGLRIALGPLDIQDKTGAAQLHVSRGSIVFKTVRFHYQDAAPLFQNLSVAIEPGQRVGLVGYSGGGKTTFVHLILRLYEVTDGQILIDGQDIREVTQDSLHSHIAMIPQDPSLFHRTLRDNIRYGRITASDEEVIEASKKAHAHEFISKLPQGYDSLVGERGVKLSGGQRQRIAMARAILKNAPILILDEATSQLDSLTESDIQESLWKVIQGKTTLVIAHRLSTLMYMDRILVFDQGQIIEDGTHLELLSKGGLYKTLWDTQIGGFLPDKKIESA